jgi:hypothetical protein
MDRELAEYYDWFYGWARALGAKVPTDTYKADIALLAWLLAETRWKLGLLIDEHLSRCASPGHAAGGGLDPTTVFVAP